MRFTLLFCAVVAAVIAVVRATDPLVCASRDDAERLLHLACTESIPAMHMFDIGSIAASGDDDDLEYERTRLSAYAQWIGVMRPFSVRQATTVGAARRPRQSGGNTAAQHLWANTSMAPAADDVLTLWYMENATDSAIDTLACTQFVASVTFDSVLSRHVRMLPIVTAMIIERALFDQSTDCPDMNERRMFDMVSHKSKCVCQQDKICNANGMRFSIFLVIIIGLACAIGAITLAVMFYAAVHMLRAHVASIAVIQPTRPVPMRWNE